LHHLIAETFVTKHHRVGKASGLATASTMYLDDVSAAL
jgi:hypothetical protein